MRSGILAAGAAVVLLLAGCTAAGGSADSAGSGAESAPEAPAEDGGGSRAVISSGTLSITADDPVAAADETVRLVEASGGRVDRRSETPAVEDGAQAFADLTVRIPSERLTATVREVRALGEVEAYELLEDDVTAESQDLDARISALRESTGRLATLLGTAPTTRDLVDIESALSTRQSELETLEARSRALVDQVSFATLEVSFLSEGVVPDDRPDDFLSGVAAGWEGLTGFVGAVLVGVGVLLPWLVVPAAAAAVVLLVLRRRRRSGPGGPPAAGATMEA